MTPHYADAHVRLYQGDCRERLPLLDFVDVVMTDPPYRRWVGENQPGKQGKLRDGSERIRDLGYAPLTSELVEVCSREFARLARRWVLVFSDVESTAEWRAALEAAGLRYVRTGAWIRECTTPQFSGDRPGVGFEAVTICHARDVKLRWNGGGRPGVWSHRIVHSTSGARTKGHPTPKPLELMTELVALFTDPGEIVLDPFAGSGTTLRAAKDLGRQAIGVELEPKWCDLIARRLAQEVLLTG